MYDVDPSLPPICAETYFQKLNERHEKGTGLSLAKAQEKASREKTLRLRAARQHRDQATGFAAAGNTSAPADMPRE
jgi:hypothetical protein